MLIRPKFVAARTFRFRGRRYAAGDPVTDPAVIREVGRYGDQFLSLTITARRAASTPVLPTDQPGDAGDDTEGDQS